MGLSGNPDSGFGPVLDGPWAQNLRRPVDHLIRPPRAFPPKELYSGSRDYPSLHQIEFFQMDLMVLGPNRERASHLLHFQVGPTFFGFGGPYLGLSFATQCFLKQQL